jgi:hypothetical protein
MPPPIVLRALGMALVFLLPSAVFAQEGSTGIPTSRACRRTPSTGIPRAGSCFDGWCSETFAGAKDHCTLLVRKTRFWEASGHGS